MALLRFKQLTVIGCGLIGGSFALAFRRIEPGATIAGWDTSPAVLKAALHRGVIEKIDEAFASGGRSDSDLIYLAMPVKAIIDFLRTAGTQLKPEAVITDAGSTKEEICRAARHLPNDIIFIGGHPIAGSEQAGLSRARANLFTGAPYVLIDEDFQLADHRRLLQKTLATIGARVKLMSAIEHDRALAKVSHLPQLLSSTIAATIKCDANSAEMLEIAGSGLRDMTRLSKSSWSMWRDIMATNPVFIKQALDDFMFKLQAMRGELDKCSVGKGREMDVARQLFNDAQSFADDQTHANEID